MTSRDVAREAGVSQNTVSLVVRDSPRVRPETKAAVRAVMARLGYHPNAVAAALRTRTTPVLLFVVGREVVHDHVAAGLLAGVVEGADSRGFSVLVVAADPRAPERAADAFRARWASGAIVWATGADDPVAAGLTEAGCPTVCLLRGCRQCPAASVVRADDEGGGRAAVQHLLGRGHRRLGLVALATDGDGLAQDRARGARAAADAAGASLLIERAGAWSVEAGLDAARRLLRRTPRPTAVFAISDRMAFGVLRAAAEAALRVPEELAVCGFDDAEWSRYSTPPLTTVEFPLRALGRIAAARLLDPGDAGPPAPVPARLVVRAST